MLEHPEGGLEASTELERRYCGAAGTSTIQGGSGWTTKKWTSTEHETWLTTDIYSSSSSSPMLQIP